MGKQYENFHILHFQKRIVSAETIRGHKDYPKYLVQLIHSANPVWQFGIAVEL